MLTRDGVKILDFGLSRILAPGETGQDAASPLTITQHGAILGTPQYMSPEQIEGKEADARSDVFAFGAVLYEMATGRKAFEADSRASAFVAILEGQPQPVSSIKPELHPLFERVLTLCLAKDPHARAQSLHDVALDLEWITSGSQVAAVPAKRRGPVVWKLAFVAFLLSGGLILAIA